MVAVTNKRVSQMGEYLKTLEAALGRPGLGWEQFLKSKPSILTWSTAGVWVLVFAMTVSAAIVGVNAASSATQVCKGTEAK
jgi:hypothetical protein